MSDFDLKAPGGTPGKPVIRPTRPGRPEAGPQPGTGGTDPTVPTVPEPDGPPDEPTDPNNPTDPTIPVDVLSDMAVLELPPEGMLRISKAGQKDQFVFPVHSIRWAADGWTVHPPISIDEGAAGGSQQSDPNAAPMIFSITPAAPLAVGGGQVVCTVAGSNFTEAGDLVVWGDSQAAAADYTFISAAEVLFTMDLSLIGAACEVPVLAVNELGESAPFALPVPTPALDASPDADVAPEPAAEVDFSSMTKAQIVAEVEATYGVALDPSQTKAELVEQAETLATEPAPKPQVEPVPGLDAPFTEPEPMIPSDLLG